MRWIQAKVFFEAENPVLATDLISEIFYDLQTRGVVVDEPGQDPPDGWAEEAVDQPEFWAVTGYLPDNAMAEKRRHVLERELKRLRENENVLFRLDCQIVDDEDWAHSWKRFFFPKKIGERIVIKPTWHDYQAQPDDIVIEIDPGMAFGTGTHPTTTLCVRMLEKYLTPGDTLLDVGTGSGILMMAAEKLGADRIFGIDSDETAVLVARQNLERNISAPGRYHLAIGNLIEAIAGKFNLVVANILSEVILELLDTVAGIMAENGLFICSGIIAENEKSVTQKMKSTGFEVLRVQHMDGWVAIVARVARTPET